MVGIEKIHVYPTSSYLDLKDLANVRGYDVNHLHNELMCYERSINPPWEDAVTMGVNAAKPMLNDDDINSIGLFVVGTETGLDQEKSLSSWMHRYLKLPSNCRHFEVKSACYSGTACMRIATSWLLSGMAKPGQKALVVTTDQSLCSIAKPWEYINGAAAVAMLVSTSPGLIQFEPNQFGIYSQEVSDVIRPLPWLETGNSDDSLFSYMESLAGSYDDFSANNSNLNFGSYFDYNIYHAPFSGITFRAHKRLMQLNQKCSKVEIQQDFNKKTKPSIEYNKRIGSSYGSSIFISILSLIQHANSIDIGNRIGIFSYGSGACAEFYSCLVGSDAFNIAQKAQLNQALDARFKLSVDEYELIEQTRLEMLRSSNQNIQIDFNMINKFYKDKYQNKKLLVLKAIEDYYRHYEFS